MSCLFQAFKGTNTDGSKVDRLTGLFNHAPQAHGDFLSGCMKDLPLIVSTEIGWREIIVLSEFVRIKL
jgi:hypothetical protein